MNVIQVVLAALLIQTPAIPQQAASISGVVVEAGAGNPIASANLELANPQFPYSTTTDSDGKFTLESLLPGSYSRLTAAASGYVSGRYTGVDSTFELKLAANQKITGIRIELTPTGTISGRVLDINGDPVANTAVQALQTIYPNGQKTWRVVESRPTNDLGEFRLFWLKPGHYYIRAVQNDSLETTISSDFRSVSLNDFLATRPPSLVRTISDDGTIEDEAMLPVYFPGTSDPKLAVSIDVRPGASFGGADFRMSAIPVYRVRGRITGAPVQAAGSAIARLIPLDSPGAPGYFTMDGSDLKATINANNDFEINGVPPGSYELAASVNTESTRWAGRTSVVIQDRDVGNLMVAMTPVDRISGRFLLDGNSADDRSPLVAAEFLLRSALPDGAYVEGIIEGTQLTFDNVPPGDYQIQAVNLVARSAGKDSFQPAYIESILAGGRDVLQDGLNVGNTMNETMAIALRSDFGRLSGHIVNASSRLVRNSTLALIPDLRNQLGRYKTFMPDASGQFHFENIAPGSYKLFAWEDIEEGAWLNAEFLATCESRGRAIQIKPGDNGPVDVPLLGVEP